ncbi:MAG: deoxyribodipyrimidine photo-lyase [Henriciella sp.]|nr:deoxyribodipyrimidine photo-lyase [Henriciella sp.]
MSRLHVLWFSNDLRVHDHAALTAACRAAEREGGEVLPLYVFDPKDWQGEAASARQFDFLLESLRDLDKALRHRGSALQVALGAPETVLLDLHRRLGLTALHLHEMPGLHHQTQAIETLCRRAGIPLRMHGQNGVTSALTAASDWRQAWRATMTAPRLTAPAHIPSPPLTPADWPDAKRLSLAPSWLLPAQKGGRGPAIELLRSELDRAQAPSIGTPSLMDRLSAYLSLGTVSVREVWQALQKAYAAEVAGQNKANPYLRDQLGALEHWCQSAQHMANKPVASANPPTANASPDISAKLRAWKNGRCGVPIVDAGMRAILVHGSAAASLQPVLLDYAEQILGLNRTDALAHLTSLCTAADPRLGAVTADAISSRSPRARLQQMIRASKALDPDGVYIRYWVPELADLPTEYLHAPSDAPVHALIESDIVIGQTYPNPGAEDAASAIPALLSAPRPAAPTRQTSAKPAKRPPMAPRPRSKRATKPHQPDPKTGQLSLIF